MLSMLPCHATCMRGVQRSGCGRKSRFHCLCIRARHMQICVFAVGWRCPLHLYFTCASGLLPGPFVVVGVTWIILTCNLQLQRPSVKVYFQTLLIDRKSPLSRAWGLCFARYPRCSFDTGARHFPRVLRTDVPFIALPGWLR